jgi:hypothetical protein
MRIGFGGGFQVSGSWFLVSRFGFLVLGFLVLAWMGVEIALVHLSTNRRSFRFRVHAERRTISLTTATHRV